MSRTTFVTIAAGFLSAVAASSTVIRAEPPAFAQKPVVTEAGAGCKVEFAVSAPTDVEVAMLDAAGKVVRHLAAGVLGGKAPPPEPLRPGLVQVVEWDGKDDFGQPAGKGPFRVRVRAGMRLNLGVFLASDPLYICYPLGLATDDAGNLYMLSTSAAGGEGRTIIVPNRLHIRQRTGPPTKCPTLVQARV